MALLKIVTHPNKILRTKCEQVDKITDELKKFTEEPVRDLYKSIPMSSMK